MWFLVLGLGLHATFLLLCSSIGVSAAANQAEEVQLPLFSHLLPLKPLESTALAPCAHVKKLWTSVFTLHHWRFIALLNPLINLFRLNSLYVIA
ncbi:hypothetical protein EMCRGX_G010703 [Ephydatia muelleri]